MPKRSIEDAIVAYLRDEHDPGSPAAITAHLGISRPTINRYLARLTAAGRLVREGSGPSTRYRIPESATPATMGPSWSPAARRLREELTRPLASREPVPFRREFVDGYIPNETALLPPAIAESLFQDSRAQGRLPAGTYARKVLEQLLIDLSWHSSRLEGNRMSLLDTRELFARGRSAANDADATMLLNHKDAIEFLVDAVPEQGITVPVVRNLHSVLMQGLLADPNAVGAIRRKIVSIDDSVYIPSQVPSLLEEMLGQVIEKSRLIRNPIEASFFLWVNIAYLQPFEDGNKRTSRLSANLPLLLANCAPLSFLDVSASDYAFAMLGVYERQNVAIACDLFEWTYRRSIIKYAAVRDAMGTPDPLRATYREQLGEAVRRVVTGEKLSSAIAALGLPMSDRQAFETLAREELRHLESYNCARYRLSIPRVEQWIQEGRPGLT